MHQSVCERLARMVHGVRYAQLPPEVVHQCKRLILDTLGCALGAYDSIPARITRDLARSWSGVEHASLIGCSAKSSAPLATLANGTMTRYHDSNDYYFGADSAHPSNNIAAAFAVAQHQGRCGRDLIAAIVIGYEVHTRLCDAVARPGISGRGWHTATHMQFTSAALAARLLSDDVAVTTNALAIAGSHLNSLAQAQRGDLPMMKATAEAFVSKGGVEAAYLAAAGLTGPAQVFEGAAGWAHGVAGSIDYDLLTRPPVDDFGLMRSCIKPYPAVAGAMAPIRAALDLRLPREMIACIEQVDVMLPEVAARKATADPAKSMPRDKETADHSIQYCVAVSLLDAACGHGQFTEARIRSQDVADLMARIRIQADEALTRAWPGASGGGVSVRFRDGTSVQKVHGQPPGHPQNPLADAELERKFRELTGELLSQQQAQSVMDTVWRLESCADFEALFTRMAVA